MTQFAYLLSHVRWQDVVDILLNAYILLRLYILFRGTNAFRILLGMAMLWFFQRVANTLGLIVTSWAMEGITAVAALIIIVVFRNEIRAVLQAKNLKAILWEFPRYSDNPPIEALGEALFELARNRIGALVVLPGKEDLEEFVQSGMAWGGVLSKEMLMSIFWPDNPVHDGAAIVKGNQITRVGAILPLSQRRDLPSYYGTRHRAAAGLAERTDALVLVVSEERGTVTLAKGSSLRLVPQREQLSRILKEHAARPARQSVFLKNPKLELGLAALGCFLFIAGIWFSFSRGMETMISLEVPLEFMNLRTGMEIVDTSVNSVQLNLSGSSTLIRSLRPEQLKVRLDLFKAEAGNNTYDVNVDDVSLPPGIILQNVKPATVRLILDAVETRDIPVQVDWVGHLPDNLILASVELDPPRLAVVGVGRVLDDVSTIYTEPVNLEELKSSTVLSLKPILKPGSLKLAPTAKNRIAAKVTLEERAPAEREPEVF